MSEDNIILEHTDIIELIPHRSPILLVDRIQDIVLNQSARGIKAVGSNEPYLDGHFPGNPIMPGVLVVEALAQTGGAFMAYCEKKQGKDQHIYLTTIDKVKFRTPVRPGDVLYLDIQFLNKKGPLYKFEGVASVNGKTVTSALLSAMILEVER
jgi:3-hydroxyacyl-[acyl-carrier-protein] dehydratase